MISASAVNSENSLDTLRHSTAHVLAQAVLDLWPGTFIAIGPPVEDGFYYDFYLPGGKHFTQEDLALIETKMRDIVAQDQPFIRKECSTKEALNLFKNQPFKQEIIETIQNENTGDKKVSLYYNPPGEFVDLCRGPHVESTGKLGAFKLIRISGAYWRGDEHREQLQRIYGTAFNTREELESYLAQLVEAEKRDHRKLGAELDMFYFLPEIGGGLPVFSPKGALVRHLMEAYSVEKHLASGYQLVWTPHLARSELFETSGHLQWYQENMYPPMEMEGVTYYPKPMNCPLHISLYANKLHSYKELPLRLFEFGTVYRFERSGVLHGLTRVRGLTQDDSHIFCAPEQLGHELTGVLEFVVQMLGAFGLREFDAELATRPDKFVGDIAEWNFAEEALRQALGASGIDYSVAEGEGAFYAPKIDIHLRDAIGRRWQVSTIQVDLQLPQRFDLSYIGPDNTKHRPFMLHRALFGSVERFMAILIEHYAGALPTWLSPVQVKVLAVRDTHEEYAKYVVFHLRERSFRAEVSLADEPLGARVRSAKLEKIPYVLVVGDDDVNGHTVGVNARGSSKALRGVGLEEFYQRLEQEVVSHG